MGMIMTDYASLEQKRTILNTIIAYLVIIIPEIMRHLWGLESGLLVTFLTLVLWDSTKKASIYYKEIRFNLDITLLCMGIGNACVILQIFTESGSHEVYKWFSLITMPFRLTGLLCV